MYLIVGVLIMALTSHFAYIAQKSQERQNLVDQKLLLKYTYVEDSSGEEKTITFIPYQQVTKNRHGETIQQSEPITNCPKSCFILLVLSMTVLKLALFAFGDTLTNLFENRRELLEREEGEEEETVGNGTD